MGYFSNGTESECFFSQNCATCKHWPSDADPDEVEIEALAEQEKTGEGCPVWLAHLLYNYDQHNKGQEKIKGILSILIPPKSKGLGNEQCRMYIRRGHKQPDLFGGESVVEDSP